MKFATLLTPAITTCTAAYNNRIVATTPMASFSCTTPNLSDVWTPSPARNKIAAEWSKKHYVCFSLTNSVFLAYQNVQGVQ
jgi:hypothetical protein